MRFDVFRAISLVNRSDEWFFDLWLVPHEFDESRASVVSDQIPFNWAGPPSRVVLARDAQVVDAQQEYANALAWKLQAKFSEQPLAREALAQSQRMQSLQQALALQCWAGESFDWPEHLHDMFDRLKTGLPLARRRAEWGNADKLSVAALLLADAGYSRPEGVQELVPWFKAPRGTVGLSDAQLREKADWAARMLLPLVSPAARAALSAQPMPAEAWQGIVRAQVAMCSTSD